MPTLVIRVVLVQLFGLVGQSGKVDGSFAPTRASSTADSQLAIHPSHLRVYSQIKTQAGLTECCRWISANAKPAAATITSA